MKKLALFAFSLSMWSCQTTTYVTKVDKARKDVEIQSQSDEGSAIHSLHAQGAMKELKEDLVLRIKDNPQDVDSLLNLSQIALSEGDLENANKYCRSALKFDLDNEKARLILAQVYFRRGYNDMADILLNSLGSAIDKDPVALNLKALIELGNDKPALAMHLFKTALKYSPGDIATRMNLGVLYVQYRQLEKAAVQFERVLKTMPDHIDAKLHLAIVKTSAGKKEQAKDLYAEVLKADDTNAIATYNLAVLAEKNAEFDDSLDYVKQYLKSNYAKSQANKEVFAMIERLKVKKDMTGDSVSDSEIQALADQVTQTSLSAKANIRKDTIESPGLGGSEEESPAKAQERKVEPVKAKPVKKKKKEYKPKNDSIESLEEELLN